MNKLSVAGITFVLLIPLVFQVAYNLGYQTASARIYSSHSEKIMREWIADLVRYEYNDFISKNAPAQ